MKLRLRPLSFFEAMSSMDVETMEVEVGEASPGKRAMQTAEDPEVVGKQASAAEDAALKVIIRNDCRVLSQLVGPMWHTGWDRTRQSFQIKRSARRPLSG